MGSEMCIRDSYRDVEYLSNIIAKEKRMPIPEMLSMLFEEDYSA